MEAVKSILYLVASSRGGGAVHVRDLAKGVDPTRFAVQVAMAEDGGNVYRQDFEESGVLFHHVDIAAGFSPRALLQIRRLAANVDIVHTHGGRAAFYGRLAAVLLGCHRPRVIYTLHGFTAPFYSRPYRDLLINLERTLAPFTDRYITVCRSEQEALLAAGICSPKRVSMVLNGFDISRFSNIQSDRSEWRKELAIPFDATLITTACRLDRPRDINTLLSAFRAVSEIHPNVHLLIVGDGPMRSETEERIERLSLSQKVTLTGWRDDMPAVYRGSDIYVLTTWGWEGLPLSVLEAMASRLPVVATRAGGVPEAVLDGEQGLLVGRCDGDGLAEKLRKLIENPETRKKMGASGRDRVEQLFTAERMISETSALYESPSQS